MIEQLFHAKHIAESPEIQNFNAAFLVFSAVIALILLACYRRIPLAVVPSKLYFSTLLLLFLTYVLYAVSFLHHSEPHDAIYIGTTAASYIGIYAAETTYLGYIFSGINASRKKKMHPGIMISFLVFFIVSILLWLLSMADDQYVLYGDRDSLSNPVYWAAHTGEIALLVCSVGLMVTNADQFNTRKTITLLSVPVLLLIATIVEPYGLGLAVRYPDFIIGLLIVYTQFHSEMVSSERSAVVSGMQDRLTLAMGRMRPHYIGNVLSSVYYLCDSDPIQAQNIIAAFSEYLRNTLETIEHPGLVPFTWELDQIRSYIVLEKMRFDDRLHVSYDLDINDFKIPPLTIQTLVENAVKHGIAELDRNGTVRIETRRLANGGTKINVVDDGVGYDISKLDEESKIYIDLTAVQERVRAEAGGDMTYESSVGNGATVTITLPPMKD